MTLDLNNWETRFVLEALATLDQKFTSIIAAAAAKGDEDTAADYGNDAMQLSIVQERIQAAAVGEFGPSIANFSREQAGQATVPNADQPQPH